MDVDPYTDNDLDTGRPGDRSAFVIGACAIAFTAAAVGAALVILTKLALG